MSNYLKNKIDRVITKLHGLTQINIQANWYYSTVDLSLENQTIPEEINIDNWQPVELSDREYIIWEKGRQLYWLAQQIIIPQHLQGYSLIGLSLRIVLTWWAEAARVFVNGKLVQQGDLFDSSARILLTNDAQPGEKFWVAIRLVSPGHDIGALMRSHCVYERDLLADKIRIEPGFVATELSVLAKYLSKFEPEKLNCLAQEIATIDWNLLSSTQDFDRHLQDLRQRLLPLAENIKQRCFYPLGHAHLDMAWLWTTEETYQVAQRTFESVLNLQQVFPYLTFGHTTSALYEWIEQHRPDLFLAIKEKIKQGNWEILGGMWVEPDVNLIGGESIIRQLLYGQKYLQEKFGRIATVAWLPDSFGFTWQLPQIFKQSGIEYFVTGKLHWNDTTKFPHGCFWWQSPDGTKLLTLMSPPNITGVMDTNPITMTNYAVEWEAQTGLKEIFWVPGVGDHGGGPTRNMLEVAAKWDNSPFFPQIQFTTASEYLTKIARADNYFPTWRDELYLELHRGCYTTHADQKKFNRNCEGLLYQAELFTTVATLIKENRFVFGTFPHDVDIITKKSKSQPWQLKIETAWKKVLFNQFHDILPGTSIPEVFTAANRDWQEAMEIGTEVLQQALEAIASKIILPPPPQPTAKPIVVFNPLNWKREEVISISTRECHWEVYDLDGKQLKTQATEDDRLLFLAEDVPAIGYRLFWLLPKTTPLSQQDRFPEDYILENQYLRVQVNPETGDLDSLFDKIASQEIIKGKGNQLQAFTDRGLYWDAWNIDPNYQQHPLPPTESISIQWLDYGEIQQRVRAIGKLGNSQFRQDYVLQINSTILKIATTVDWQETHVVVKAAFPLNLESDYTTYEIACGAIQRSNRPKTPAEKAKWEVSALKWADLTDPKQNYGVSLLNDGKYGYDSQPDRLRLTLLRSPLWPDPTTDKGIHQFTYAIYPHRNSWELARTVHKSYELNLPLQVIDLCQVAVKELIGENHAEAQRHRGEKKGDFLFEGKSVLDSIPSTTQQLPPVGSFLDLSAENLILMALKPGKKEGFILRCYECHGQEARLELQGNLDLKIQHSVDLLERQTSDLVSIKQSTSCSIRPWQITSFKISSK
jgi:alpha-mannosidase